MLHAVPDGTGGAAMRCGFWLASGPRKSVQLHLAPSSLLLAYVLSALRVVCGLFRNQKLCYCIVAVWRVFPQGTGGEG